MRKVWCNVADEREDHRDDWRRLNNRKVVGDASDDAGGRVVIIEVMDGVSAGFKRHYGENEGERKGGQLPGGVSPRAHRVLQKLLDHRVDHITEVMSDPGRSSGPLRV